ncbi:O-antigen ligase family protein [Patescibacteria group bacterium]|nr:O-antigen ligase family protein [Patescibacteria group bacterium]MBU1922314.1 O-antigen ligase family protein [Patescibacteria group bacterium]
MKETNKNNQTVIKSKVSIFCSYAIEGLWLFLLVAMPLFYYRSHQSFNMPKTQLLCVVVGFMFALWLIKSLEEKKFSFRWGAFGILCAAYLLVLILSTVFGYYPAISWWGCYVRFEGLSTYLFFVLSFFLIFWNLKTFAQIKRIFVFAALASLPVSVYGLCQYFGYDFLKFTGTTAGFKSIISTMGNQLLLSNYLIMILPLAAALVFISKRIYFKIFWLLIIFLNIWALVLTGRRSGFLALLAICFVGGFLLIWRWRKTVALGLLIAVIALAVFTAFNFNKIVQSEALSQVKYLNRMATIFDFEDVTIKERLMVWQIATGFILERPIIGYGPDSFLYVFDAKYPPYFTEMPENYFDRAHNFILDTAYSSGLLGLLAFMGLIGLAFVSSVRFFVKQRYLKESYFAWAVAVSIIGFLVHNLFMFEGGATRYILFVILAVAACLPMALKSLTRVDAQENGTNDQVIKIKFWQNPEYKTIYYALLLAAGAYVAAFHIAPIIGDFHYNKALGYGKLEHKQAREQELKKAMYYIRDVRSARYYGKLASDYFIYAQNIEGESADKYFEQSVEWYGGAIEKDPQSFTSVLELAQVYMVWSAFTQSQETKQAKIDLATKYFEQAVSLSPGRQMIYWDWGRSLLHAGFSDQGIEKFIHAVEMDVNVGRSYFQLGKAYRDIGDQENARQAFDRAYELGYFMDSETTPL